MSLTIVLMSTNAHMAEKALVAHSCMESRGKLHTRLIMFAHEGDVADWHIRTFPRDTEKNEL